MLTCSLSAREACQLYQPASVHGAIVPAGPSAPSGGLGATPRAGRQIRQEAAYQSCQLYQPASVHGATVPAGPSAPSRDLGATPGAGRQIRQARQGGDDDVHDQVDQGQEDPRARSWRACDVMHKCSCRSCTYVVDGGQCRPAWVRDGAIFIPGEDIEGWHSKGYKPRRIPLTPRLEAEINRLLALSPDRKYVFGNRPNESSTPRARDVNDYAARAGVRDDVDFHGLRRTFVTRLLRRNCPIHIAAKIVGDTVDVLVNDYAGFLPGDADVAVARLAEPVPVKQAA